MTPYRLDGLKQLMQAIPEVAVDLFDGLDDRILEMLVQFLANQGDRRRNGANAVVVDDLGLGNIDIVPAMSAGGTVLR